MPTWNQTINVADVFRNEGLPFEQRRDTIVARVREFLTKFGPLYPEETP